ncbi:manganese catalase family protein [Pontibacter harenae]|uniref:manganese catalase family protein n=1 Tax=Pontibacter harenae TaxID=2894083 RepID=UPI001E3D660A|nr:manganese catalase family protein [Pontibacter harenae]MCC9166618.1 manganese catalase family protein [Pontibacter harenae]
MFYHDSKLQYKVKVDKPNPAFANMLQQAIGGIEGEIRVCLQYLFQAWGQRGPVKYRDMLMETGTEEIAHIEMLATAVALNLEGAPVSMQEEMAKDKVVGAVMGGMNPRHVLSSGMAAMAMDSNGVPFNGSWVVGTGNLAADMYANVMAESSGRLLATRLWEATDDAGMKDMLAFLIARDTMHQNQWLAVLEELGGLNGVHPIPNSFPQTMENHDFNYAFVSTKVNDMEGTAEEMLKSRWGSGKSMDGKGEFKVVTGAPQGTKPELGAPHPQAHAQKEQMTGGKGLSGIVDAAKKAL